MQYITVAASQTDAELGTAGLNSPGDVIERLVITVNDANSTVSIKDNTTSIPIMPASIAGGVGVYPVHLGITSKSGRFKVTTSSGVTVIAVGQFK